MNPRIALRQAALLALALSLHASAQDDWPLPCARTDKTCNRAAMNAHPSHRLAGWRELLAQPILERVEPAPSSVVEYLRWDNLINGYPQKPRSTQARPAFVAEVKAALADLPPQVLLLFDTKLAGIALVDDLGGTGFTSIVSGEDGQPVAGYIVLDAQVLGSRTANEWATWKEASPFAPEPGWRVTARIEAPAQDNRRNAIQYILLHELGHVLSIGSGMHPPWTMRPKDVADPHAYPFFDSSWRVDTKADRYESHYEAQFPLRRDVAYYFGPKLRASQARETYAQLALTNFPTLYASTIPGDDFAESFASYVHVVLMRRPWQVSLLHEGEPDVVIGPCWDEPRCADKRRMLEKLLGGPQ